MSKTISVCVLMSATFKHNAKILHIVTDNFFFYKKIRLDNSYKMSVLIFSEKHEVSGWPIG